MARRQSVGDMATVRANELRDAHLREIENTDHPVHKEQQVMSRSGKSLFSKIAFSWREEDRMILDQIRGAADMAFAELFSETLVVFDQFYGALRVPKVNQHGIVMVQNGRTIWETDEGGKPVEDWNQITGQDIEKTLIDLQYLRMTVSGQINQLLLEALMAKNICDDVAADAYQSVLDGTVGDRNAKASRDSRQDKYSAYYRFYLWSVGDTFAKEMDSFTRLLVKMRTWRSFDETAH